MTRGDAVLERARDGLRRALLASGAQVPEATLHELHLPLAELISAWVSAAGACQVVGIAGAQGTGKSTLTRLLEPLLQDGHGLRVLAISLDDFYLSRSARSELARDVHPLLITRGVPGTHDVPALHDALRRARSGEPIELPCFSKAHDDRLPDTRHCQGPFDVVLFEGWCVGARPVPAAELREPINALERAEDADGTFRQFVNDQLADPYARLFRELAKLVYLAAEDMASVLRFRAEQEQKLRESANAGALGVQDDEQLARFVAHFERITRQMMREAPGYADVLVPLDAQRRPVS